MCSSAKVQEGKAIHKIAAMTASGSAAPRQVYGLGWTPLNILSIVGLAMIGIGFLGSPQVFVRFISIKSEKEILPGTIVALAWTLLADGGAVLVGIVRKQGHTCIGIACTLRVRASIQKF